jgi:hypothetical protein
MKIAILFFAAFSALLNQSPVPAPASTQQTAPELTIHSGQSVYIVAIDTSARDTSLSSVRLELERKAREQFSKEKKFVVSKVLKTADFVFVIALDPGSKDSDEIALAVSTASYKENISDIDKLRNAAVWQSDEHFHRGKEAGKNAALGAATLGYGNLFRHPSVAKDLVKKFHKDMLK